MCYYFYVFYNNNHCFYVIIEIEGVNFEILVYVTFLIVIVDRLFLIEERNIKSLVEYLKYVTLTKNVIKVKLIYVEYQNDFS